MGEGVLFLLTLNTESLSVFGAGSGCEVLGTLSLTELESVECVGGWGSGNIGSLPDPVAMGKIVSVTSIGSSLEPFDSIIDEESISITSTLVAVGTGGMVLWAGTPLLLTLLDCVGLWFLSFSLSVGVV